MDRQQNDTGTSAATMPYLLQEQQIGAFEARDRFSDLLRETEYGASFLITHQGLPVGRLVPPYAAPAIDRTAIIARLMAFGERRRLEAGAGGLSALRAEGRR